MILDFLKTKKRKAEEERIEKLEKAKDLWLNYELHYVLYSIQHRNPITGEVETFHFPKRFSRKDQRDAFEKNNNDTWTILAIREGQSLLNEKVGYWIGGKASRGTIIQTPLDVNYKEITKTEYDKVQEA